MAITFSLQTNKIQRQNINNLFGRKFYYITIQNKEKMTADDKSYSFKSENKFIVKSGCKKRIWRSLKQILTAERALPWPNDAVLYYSINAPPTFKPTKKYSDISGLPAPYVDRHSKLYYSNIEEFATVRSLPMDITAGYLQLRGASTVVG